MAYWLIWPSRTVLWYDKLKPRGMCINGAIDGFSCFIIWLEANQTSSDPRVIAGYYMKALRKLHWAPCRLRADLGTENTYVSQMQLFLRSYNTDQFENISFVSGASTHNRRIGQWWGFLRKENANYLMNTFAISRDMGEYKVDSLTRAWYYSASLIWFR